MNIKKILCTLAVTTILSAPMLSTSLWAASPKPYVTVNSDITLGDVFEDVTTNADHVLAPAPALGKSMTLTTYDLNRISKAFNLGWHSTGSAHKTVIKRSSTVLDHNQAVILLKQALAEKMNDDNFEMEFSTKDLSFVLSGNITEELSVQSLKLNPVHNSFSANIGIAGKTKRVSGHVFRLIDVPVLAQRIGKGDIISKRDIEYITLREGDLTTNILTNAESLIGQTPRRGISASRPIKASDVHAPLIVKKGDLVIMTLKKGALNLTTKGQALDNGAKGDMVRILNTSSRQTVEAQVTGPQKVTVSNDIL